MSLTEKQIEDVFSVFYRQLIPQELELIGRQQTLPGVGLRVDLLFQNKSGQKVVLELKKDAITREDVGQTLQYAGLIENSRVILGAPFIADTIKKAFDHYGIEYIEFKLAKISELYDRMRRNPKIVPSLPATDIGMVISEPLEGRRIPDGNIAFKVTYVDSGWNGVCSDNICEYNREHRRWCQEASKGRIDCRHSKWTNPDNLNADHYPCYDSVALKALQFSPGVDHGKTRAGTPRRCKQAKVGKLALFTSVEPGQPENERFIFAVAKIGAVFPVKKNGFEVFRCKKQGSLVFHESLRPRFWRYYANPNKPEKKAWGSGLFRYVTDKQVRSLLEDVIRPENGYSEQLRSAAAELRGAVE
jgi:hypothetical protein